MPTEATIDNVGKAIDHRFRQAGPSTIKKEHSNGQPRGVLLGSDCFVTVPRLTRLEVDHHQYTTLNSSLTSTSGLGLSYFMPCLTQYFRVLINCIPNVTFARPFLPHISGSVD